MPLGHWTLPGISTLGSLKAGSFSVLMSGSDAGLFCIGHSPTPTLLRRWSLCGAAMAARTVACPAGCNNLITALCISSSSASLHTIH